MENKTKQNKNKTEAQPGSGIEYTDKILARFAVDERCWVYAS